MSRRLQAEIDKVAREAKANLDLYDERWQELRNFNHTQMGVKERMWEEARREQMRGKKHAVRTATLELLDFKHVCDSKVKMEADLEGTLRRMHRHKQQLAEWLGLSELRTQYDELKDLRKQIELRYKRGRVFYCLGQSSEDKARRELTAGAAEQAEWISDFIEKLKSQSQEWVTEMQQISKTLEEPRSPTSKRQPTQTSDAELMERKAQLGAFVELHALHLAHLEGILKALNEHNFQLPEATADEIHENLRMYLEDNSDLSIVVADEIYHELELPADSSPDEASESEESEDTVMEEMSKQSEPSPRPESAPKASSSLRPLPAMPKVPTASPTIARARATSPKAWQNKSTVVVERPQSRAKSSEGVTEGKAQATLHLVAAVDQAACDWRYEGRGSPSDSSTASKTLRLSEGDNLYIVKLDESGWSFAFQDSRSGTAEGSPLTPRRTHLKADAMQKLKGGWFPNSVRQSTRVDRLAKPTSQKRGLRQTAPVAEAEEENKKNADPFEWMMTALDVLGKDAVEDTSRHGSLLDRLKLNSSDQEDINWFISQDEALRPCSVRLVRWPWQAGQLVPEKTQSNVRFLSMKAGEHVWIERLSENADWVECRRLWGQESDACGWAPASLFVKPETILSSYESRSADERSRGLVNPR